MKIYRAFDDTGNPANVVPVTRHRTRNRQWFIDWASGRAPDFFRYLSDAKAFVQKVRPSHPITEWVVCEADEEDGR